MYSKNLVEDDDRVAEIVRGAKRIAVLGIKTAEAADQASFYVPEYLQKHGVEIVPIPVYYPEATEILGQPVYRTCAAVPGKVDILDVFRRPKDIPAHLPDILQMKPACVWFQLGIRNDAAAEALARAGIAVVQDRCLKVEYARAVKGR
ncbi:MAG: CoA-binding protein [Deltaproteobacteria bacterium]|nr:CoA-binding protein [Deltaproteobacteria bacterium]